MAGSGSNVRDASPFWMDAAAARLDVFAEAYAKSAAPSTTPEGSTPFSLWPGVVSPAIAEGLWRSYQPARTTEESSRDFRFGFSTPASFAPERHVAFLLGRPFVVSGYSKIECPCVSWCKLKGLTRPANSIEVPKCLKPN